MSLYSNAFAVVLRTRTTENPDIDWGVAAVLIACVSLLTGFAWQSILLRRPISWRSLRPVLSLTLSSTLQVTFIVLVTRGIVTLNYSKKFAVFGLPLCIVELVLAIRTERAAELSPRTLACVISSLVIWLFLMTIH